MSTHPSIPEKDLTNALAMSDVKELRVITNADESKNIPKESIELDKSQVGLGQVDNTSDADKPISDDAAIAIGLKVDNTRLIIAGNGTTGGGELSADVTINVAATNDSIIVEENGIKVDTVDALDSVSQTKPLSAKQGKALNDEKESLANKSTDILIDALSNDKYPSVKVIKDYVDQVSSGLLENRGGYDASVDLFPSAGGSGPGGTILRNDLWYITVEGILSGSKVLVGSSIFAKVDNPGQTNANWERMGSSLTYVAEDIANKSTNILGDSGSDIKYPTVKAVETELAKDEKIANKSTNITSDTGSDVKYPTVNAVEDYVTASLVDSLPAAEAVLHPELAYQTRVLADLGLVNNKEALLEFYGNYLNSLPNTRILLIPELASKERASGLNKYGIKIYGMDSANSDAVQLTDATQPYMTITAAPNARKAIRFVQGQTQTGLLNFPDVSFLATDSWTLTMMVKINSKGLVDINFGTSYILIQNNSIALNNNTINILIGTYSFECGKTYSIDFQYNNGVGLVKINDNSVSTTANSGAITFSQISYISAYPFDGHIYHIHLQSGVKSAYQSNLDYTMLRAFYPEIEGVAIGNQYWATDSLAVSADGAGNTITEIQGATTDGNPELITNHTFDTSVGWSTTGESTISGGVARLYSSAGALSQIILSTVVLTVGKWYRATYDITAFGSGAFVFGNSLEIPSTTVGNAKVFYFKASETYFQIKRISTCDITFDNIYLKEAGWSDSTLIYNQVYAATSGDANAKDRAACIAAGWWCHYNNDPAMGAIYGKLYNYYAAKMLYYNPISGWRVPFSADLTQLQTYLGGSTVAGGKLKAKFGGFDNAFADNSSGFSAIAGGRRNYTDGAFREIDLRYWVHHIDSVNSGLYLRSDSIQSFPFLLVGYERGFGQSLRLLRNSPVGPDTRELSTNWINTNFATGTNVDLPIPFGYKVTGIRVNSRTNISALQAVLYTGAGVAKETLITGKSVIADTPISFSVSTDQTILLQDGFVRFNGTKTATGEYMMLTVLLKKVYKDQTI